MLESLLVNPPLWYVVMAAAIVCLVVIATRIRSYRMQPAYLLALCLGSVGGLVLISAATNRIARTYLAIPLAFVLGSVLAVLLWWLRSRVANRGVARVALGYVVAFVVLSFELDWFDARGLVPAGLLAVVAMTAPSPDGSVAASRVDRIACRAAVVFLSIGIYLALALFYSLLNPERG
jgi:hypothetical protein